MASSRWKRFAFFERHTLQLSPEVLEDLIPVESESSNAAGATGDRRSLRTLQLSGQEAVSRDSVGLVVSTAALPLSSKPAVSSQDQSVKSRSSQQDADAVQAMWASLMACTSAAAAQSDQSIQLPSQGHGEQSLNNRQSSMVEVLDGLVLAFVTSRDTNLVHCFDITARCNPPPNEATGTTFGDLDGWRGYFAPIPATARQDPASSGAPNPQDENILGLAACRIRSDYRPLHLACISHDNLVVWEDPHLYLYCRKPLSTPSPGDAFIYAIPPQQQSLWNKSRDGSFRVVDIQPGMVAVGTDEGVVFLFVYNYSDSARPDLRLYLRIKAPAASGMEVVSVKLSMGLSKASVFVAYNRQAPNGNSTQQQVSTAGICCYDVPLPGPSPTMLSAPSARHDLDGRYVGSSSLVDSCSNATVGERLTVARPDGLYSYSHTERIGVAPIDHSKLAICLIPPPIPAEKTREIDLEQVGPGYALVASTDAKSGRDAVDIYDSTNKLVASHWLLSPGHRAVRAAGVTTLPTYASDGTARGGRSSAVVLTSGGSLVTLTEKLTEEKIALLVQKNLYSAAIVVAYADPSFEAADITTLYQRYAEHLYKKGDFSGAMDQYMHTIGSLESSHVIFRYIDAPKIPLLVKYLEKLRSRELATPVHNELLRTCYLKLNDTEAAEAIAVSTSRSVNSSSLASILMNLTNNPKEALASICSLEADQAAEVLVAHGASLARVLPRETAGVVISLCVGTYSPKALAEAANVETTDLNKMIQSSPGDHTRVCEPYPVHLFASAFVEHPRMLRLVLAHCNRNKCPLTPSLRRTLLELTLAEWNQAKRTGDTEAEKLRHKEAIAALTDSHSREIGDYDALVIVQQAGFEEGELLLYERLQMTPMLLERYAKDGSEKSRRQMLAMCQADPEVLADVLGNFVSIASEKLNQDDKSQSDDGSEDNEAEEIMEDIQEALALAKRQGVLPPVRIARILAGEGTAQFSADTSSPKDKRQKRTVPLSVALEYVGTILEESRKEITRLKSEVEEYNQLCNSMETEIDSLLRASQALPPASPSDTTKETSRLNIEDQYAKIRADDLDSSERMADQAREAFWREMNQSEDSFETIARFFAKGVIR